MDEYAKEPSDALTRFRAGEIDKKEYLEETQDDVVEVLTEEAAATAERVKERDRVDRLLRDSDSRD
jgi:hypothetical protein